MPIIRGPSWREWDQALVSFADLHRFALTDALIASKSRTCETLWRQASLR
jgi:hypothetical protein